MYEITKHSLQLQSTYTNFLSTCETMFYPEPTNPPKVLIYTTSPPHLPIKVLYTFQSECSGADSAIGYHKNLAPHKEVHYQPQLMHAGLGHQDQIFLARYKLG